MEIETGVPLSRLTTIGTGGPARRSHGRARSPSSRRRSRGGRKGDDGVVVGLGSNLLAADEGVDALVLRLAGELAAVDVDGDAARGRWRRGERGVPPPGA